MNFPPVTTPTTWSFFQSGTIVKTKTPVLLVSVKIASANSARKAFVIFNNSANSTYICFDSPADSSHCARVIPTFASWEWVYPICYTGDIYAIRNAGSGDTTVWGFT